LRRQPATEVTRDPGKATLITELSIVTTADPRIAVNNVNR